MGTPLKNNDLKKWEMKAHTKVKHEILSKYLLAWTRKMSKFQKICYFDCFAGRGEYDNGDIGSPLIALRIASNNNHLFKKYIFTFIEKDKENYENLKNKIKDELKGKEEMYKNIDIIGPINDEFANVAKEILKSVNKISPSFFFIDPFGYSGLPFEIIKGIMSYEHTEVFVTLMNRDIARFYSDEKKEKAYNELFGTEKWVPLRKFNGVERENKTRNLYISQLKKIAKWVRPYKLSMDEYRRTGYYLIHATNVFDGFKIMTDIMYRQNKSGGIFAYLGPDEGQMRLCDYSDNYEKLKEFLLKKFSKQTLTFVELIKKCYEMIDDCIEPIYKKILKELESENKIIVKRITSKTNRGLQGFDRICFK